MHNEVREVQTGAEVGPPLQEQPHRALFECSSILRRLPRCIPYGKLVVTGSNAVLETGTILGVASIVFAMFNLIIESVLTLDILKRHHRMDDCKSD